MSKNLLEIVMPASLLVIAGAIGGCLLLLGQHLNAPSAAVFATSVTVDSIVVTPYGVMRVTATGTERLPDSLAARYLPSVDSSALGLDPANIAAGDALFKGNCAQCHALHDVVVGPALAGINQRRPRAWMISWVKNSSKLVASGDEYAVKIFHQYQKQQMPSFQLSNEEINQIIDYVESEQWQGMVSVVD